MTYLQKLTAEKEAREKYETDVQRLKELTLRINDMHTVHDGEFLTALENFLNAFKPLEKK